MRNPDALSKARRWWQYAQQDLAAAVECLSRPEAVYRHTCMFAQQAGENAIKACLVCEQVEFPKTHDLNRLRELVPSDWAVAGVKQGLASLSEWAAESRYPGNWVEATREDAEESVRTAQAVLEAAESDFAVRGMTD